MSSTEYRSGKRESDKEEIISSPVHLALLKTVNSDTLPLAVRLALSNEFVSRGTDMSLTRTICFGTVVHVLLMTSRAVLQRFLQSFPPI